jgi:AcrR family transcriptional regulator
MATQAERRIPLSRDRVLQAAIDLADEGGIDALSMRKLGQALGVEAMSLYNHVANKDDLFDGIIDLVLAEVELPSSQEDWETSVWKSVTSFHDTLMRHGWACSLLMSFSSVRPTRLRYMEALMQCLREAGFSPAMTYHAYHALDSHIVGFTLWQLGHIMPGSESPITTTDDIVRALAKRLPMLDLDDYPYLVEHAKQHLTDGPHKTPTEFDFVLQLILDGLKRIRDQR